MDSISNEEILFRKKKKNSPCSINCLSASSISERDKDLAEQQPPALHCEAAAAKLL